LRRWQEERGSGGPPPDTGQFAGGPLTDDPAHLGFIAVDLASSFPQWVRRRKTTYRFLDEATVALRRSVDLVLPDIDWFAGQPPREGQTIYIPLDIFKKETLAGFSVFDQEGRPVSVLNTHENGVLSTEGFSVLVDRYAPPPAGRFREALRGVIIAPTEDEGGEALDGAMVRDSRACSPTEDSMRRSSRTSAEVPAARPRDI
jgi:hypothetical protein